LLSLKELLLMAYFAEMKSKGFKYEDLKKKLKEYYNMNDFSFSFKDLEEGFDYYWANVIVPVNKENLK
jgi:hypothetical protein